MSTAHPLRVGEVRRETADAVTVVFDVPTDLVPRYRGSAGQHVVVRLHIDGRDVRRPYSLSSSPETGAAPAITVKRTRDGYASVFITERLLAGDVVSVEPPAGNFVLGVSPANYRTYYLFAAGSGITPIMSHLRTIMHIEPKAHVRMAYANSRFDSIIFRDQLSELATDPRLSLVHHLSRGRRWNGAHAAVHRGRMDADAVRMFMRSLPPVSQDCRYLVCGPPGFIEVIESALRVLGVPEDDILLERFAPPPPTTSDDVVDDATASVTASGTTATASVPAGDSILTAMRANGADLPYACESGVCGTCIATLETGSVHMPVTFGLTREQIRSNLILLCQARPTTDTITATIP